MCNGRLVPSPPRGYCPGTVNTKQFPSTCCISLSALMHRYPPYGKDVANEDGVMVLMSSLPGAGLGRDGCAPGIACAADTRTAMLPLFDTLL